MYTNSSLYWHVRKAFYINVYIYSYLYFHSVAAG